MKSILISLSKEAYKNFLDGNKKYEYRNKWPKEKVIAFIYKKGKKWRNTNENSFW